MNEFVFQMAVVFLPGLTWLAIVDKLTTGAGKRAAIVTALRAFAFGVTSYFIWFTGRALAVRLIWHAWPQLPEQMTKGAPGVAYVSALRGKDIAWTTVLSFVLALLWSAAANRKLFLRLMQWARITRKFGDEGVWEYTLNMGTPAVEFVNVRDFENKVIYSGFVRAFSEGGKSRELLLDRVVVYDLETGKEFLQVPLLYLSRKVDVLHVEYPYREPEKTDPKGADDATTERRGQGDGTGRGNSPKGGSEHRVPDNEPAPAPGANAETGAASAGTGPDTTRADK